MRWKVNHFHGKRRTSTPCDDHFRPNHIYFLASIFSLITKTTNWHCTWWSIDPSFDTPVANAIVCDIYSVLFCFSFSNTLTFHRNRGFHRFCLSNAMRRKKSTFNRTTYEKLVPSKSNHCQGTYLETKRNNPTNAQRDRTTSWVGARMCRHRRLVGRWTRGEKTINGYLGVFSVSFSVSFLSVDVCVCVCRCSFCYSVMLIDSSLSLSLGDINSQSPPIPIAFSPLVSF